MRLIMLIFLFTLSLQAEKILVINSDNTIEKYKNAYESFNESFKEPFTMIDASTMNKNEIKEYLYDEYPDIVYAIGSKAYQYAYKYLPEKKIFFSSIVNWKRLPLNENQYGIANELHSGVQLTLIKSLFPNIDKITIIYSRYTTDVYKSFYKNAKLMGIKILSKKITHSGELELNGDIKGTKAYILIPDPVLFKKKERIEELFNMSKKHKKPVFAYNELFIDYGALLVTSVDDPTIGRQVANMINRFISKEDVKKVQYPMGSKIIFNKRSASELGIEYNENAFSTINKVIE